MKKLIILLIICISIISVMITGCDLPGSGTSITSRINQFEDHLNTDDRDTIYTHFHPQTGQYNEMKASLFWEVSSLSTGHRPFSFSSISEPSDIGGGQMQVTANFSNDALTDTCTMIMQEDGEDDWYIREFHLGAFNIVKTVQ
jgi:hypothetical protein